MSEYRVNKLTGEFKTLETIKFDNKEDAEHFAKNQSTIDTENIYEVQRNHQGKFSLIKTYEKGEVLNMQ